MHRKIDNPRSQSSHRLMQTITHQDRLMKCLSVCQPFADLIVSGAKTIELRRWSTRYRGNILIHAPLNIRYHDCERLNIDKNCITGAIIGKARLVDVKVYTNPVQLRQDSLYHMAGDGFESNRYGFVLTGAQRFKETIPYKGKLGLFEVAQIDI